MMTDQRNLILAIVISVGIILGFQVFYEMPRVAKQQQLTESQETGQPGGGVVQPTAGATGAAGTAAGGAPAAGTTVGAAQGPAAGMATSRAEALARLPRERINSLRLNGSIALDGGRFDDLSLVDYRQTVDPNSPEIELLNPVGAPNTYFAEFGWVPDGAVTVPNAETAWETSGGELTENTPVELSWDNGEGLLFQKQVAVDENFMFTLARSVTNNSDQPVTLFPYGLVSRWGTPKTSGYYILHEGPIGVLDGTLKEIDYDDLHDEAPISLASTGGWAGFTDKYWLTSLVPDQAEALQANFRHFVRDGQDRYQVDYLGTARVVQPGETVTVTDRLFAGAKEVRLLDAYGETYGIPLFDRAVDFGWFYFLTKPFFYILTFFYHNVFGNYGLAILALTLLVKALFFPLANKSYRSMSQMKKLQPEMVKLRERHANDKQKMQQELMALYKREKVNPMAGCLPILLQIPVFFALYKVLFVSIEMRHAPFFGWIRDLSAPDPTTVFNLFGLLPFTPPHFLMIGVWPLIMGFTMWLQFRLNPQPADPIQAKVMGLLPFIFVFLFATFPAGLVIYWTWNNLLSISQQWLIMKRMGVRPG